MQVPENVENQEQGNGNTQGVDSQPVSEAPRPAQLKKKGRTLTPEHKAALHAGRERARLAKREKSQ